MKRIAWLLLALTACGSPEAARKRGGGAGADPGNRDAVVELNGGAQPYHDTPCKQSDDACKAARR
jgi:hypothetical protein